MRGLRRFGLAALVAAGLLAPGGAGAVDGDRFGEVSVTKPSGPMRGAALLFSGAAGWGAAERDAAAQLAQDGALVVGIDSRFYLYRLAEVDEACHVLIGDAEGLSRLIQRDYGDGGYRSPILAGVGVGGVIAGSILAQARENTVAGAVALDPPFEAAVGRPACSDVSALTVAPDAAAHGPGAVHGFWTVGLRPDAAPQERARLDAWAAAGAVIERQDVAAGLDDTAALVALVAPHLEAPARSALNLPLVEMPAADPSGTLAVVVSGDGGWRDIDQVVAGELQKAGVSVVGLDSLRYFWHRKSPDQFGQDLAAVLQHYTALWHPKRVILVGYSFGADVLPFGFNRLPDGARKHVAMLALLGFSTAADFEIRVTGWLGASASTRALPVMPEMERIPGALVQCFYGEDDAAESACPALAARGAEVVKTPGAHHFGGDYPLLVQRILAGLGKRGT
jgi:type IV secretory pathway VirJ component